MQTDWQQKVEDFVKERNWDKENYILVYNMLCNIGEETGELWGVLKWIKSDEDLKKVMVAKEADLKDGIGDLLWCIVRLANAFDVDMWEALKATHTEYEERFPVEIVKTRNGNPTLGGYDGKYQ